ncbi:hypothetical protein TNCV_3354971 [Trichonephila clavipes]|nr:hypothetical protein TNCV_3354971 [Trichonephila clavipes]
MYPSQSKFLLESYDDATKVPYGYLCRELKPETNERPRIRTKINEDMHEPQKEFENSNAEDLKSPNEDSKEVLGFIKQETSAENIEQEMEKTTPKKYKTIIKEIFLFIQKHREEIYRTPEKEL